MTQCTNKLKVKQRKKKISNSDRYILKVKQNSNLKGEFQFH